MTRLILVFCVAALTVSAHACCVQRTPEQLIESASLIVIGKLSDRTAGENNTATATLAITRVLKGEGDLKKVEIQFQNKPTTTASYTYNGDEEGLWYLSKAQPGKGEKTYYTTTGPDCLVRTVNLNADDKKVVDAMIESVATATAIKPIEQLKTK